MHKAFTYFNLWFVCALDDSRKGSSALRAAHKRTMQMHSLFSHQNETKQKMPPVSTCHGATDRPCSSRSADLLSGLVGLVGAAGSMPPLDVESAADTLRSVLIGRTAQTAAKTLSDVAAPAPAASTGTGGAEQKRVRCPATAVGEALLAWKEGSGLMKVIILYRSC